MNSTLTLYLPLGSDSKKNQQCPSTLFVRIYYQNRLRHGKDNHISVIAFSYKNSTSIIVTKACLEITITLKPFKYDKNLLSIKSHHVCVRDWQDIQLQRLLKHASNCKPDRAST